MATPPPGLGGPLMNPTEPRTASEPTVAVVLSGAAARGAFQAGALAELIPALAERGVRPTIWLGTSAGSINASLWAAALHRGVDAAAAEVLDVWRAMSDDNVFRSLLPFSLAFTGLQFAAGAVLGRGPGTTSLLDTAPLQQTAEQLLSTTQLAANVAAGVVESIGVVATRMPSEPDAAVAGSASGRSVLFLDERSAGDYRGDPGRALDVVHAPITAEHVLASSAIPVAFPPIRITEPEEAEGWYVDGGVRLNTPLHPAIGLGADRIVLVSATSTTYGPQPRRGPAGRIPDIDDAAAQVLHAVLADRMVEDLATLRRTNRMVAQAEAAGHRGVLTGRSGRAYGVVEVMPVAPPPDEMGRIAAEVFARRTDGLGWLTETDNWLLGRLIRGAGDAAGRRELLSYLFFDEEYFAASIELGRRMAAQALAAGWQR
jgi:NTE family protein